MVKKTFLGGGGMATGIGTTETEFHSEEKHWTQLQQGQVRIYNQGERAVNGKLLRGNTKNKGSLQNWPGRIIGLDDKTSKWSEIKGKRFLLSKILAQSEFCQDREGSPLSGLVRKDWGTWLEVRPENLSDRWLGLDSRKGSDFKVRQSWPDDFDN
jgi:hypothetical protein